MAKDEYGIAFTLDDNVGDVMRRLQGMQTKVKSLQSEMTKLGDVTKKDAVGSIQDLEDSLGHVQSALRSAAKENVLGHSFKGMSDEIGSMAGKMKDLRAAHTDMLQAAASGDKELFEQKKKYMKETFSQVQREKAAVLNAMEEQSKKMKKVFVDDKKALDKVTGDELPKNLGKGIGQAIKAALSGDVQGIVSGLTTGAGGFAKAGAGQVRHASQKRSMKKELAGGVAGGGKAGAMMGGLGKLAKILGPLAAAVGGIAMIVKLLMDAEAQTKELNKELLSQVPYYTLAQQGFGNVKDVMAEMRESATDFSTNMKLGLEPKQHYEVIGALVNHNMNLKELASEYQSFGEMATNVVSEIRRQSLNTGASLTETAEFFATMSDLHNRTFKDISTDMNMITQLASEAGVSTKKFFGVVSQLSGQMGLYNYKLEDTAMLLANMNKIMDSKSAEEFTTSMTTGLKDMNGQERLRKIILAGQGKMQRELRDVVNDMFTDIVKVDKGFMNINASLKELGAEGVSNAQELQQRLKELRKEGKYNELMYKVQEKGGEKVGRALSMAGKMSSDVEAGGLRLADALGNLGAIGNIEMEVSILEKLFGPIERIPLILAESMGYNEKQLKQMQRFTEISRGQTKALMRQFQNVKDGVLAEKDFEAFAKAMGIDAVIRDGQLVNEKTNQLIKDEYDVQRAMTSEAKERAKDSAKKQMSAAEKQVAATQKVADLLQYMIYDVLNGLSSTVEGMYGFLVKALSFFVKDDEGGKDVTDLEKKTQARQQALRVEERALRDLRRQRMQAPDELTKEKLSAQITSKERAMKYERAMTAQAGPDKATTDSASYKKHVMGGGQMGYAAFEKLRTQISSDIKSKVIAEISANKSDGGVYKGSALGVARRRMTKKALKEDLPKEMEATLKLTEDGNDIQEEIRKTLASSEMTREQQVKESNKILEDRGININTTAAKRFRDAQVEAYQINQMTDRLSSSFGSQAGSVAQMMFDTGGTASDSDIAAQDPMNSMLSAAQQQAIAAERKGFPTTHDAKIMSSGVAPLSFMPGDLVIKESSIARTKRGPSGSMLKQVLGGGGGGGGSQFNFNVTVNGGNSNDVREEIVKAYEQIKRKEMGG